jgi:predicted nucleic acid-binding protein
MRSCCACATVSVADAYVVDTGVFLRWFIDQDGFEHARGLQQRLIDGAVTAATVDFARIEVAGVLRKKGFLAGRLTLEEFTAAVRVIDDIGVTVHPTTVDRLARGQSRSPQDGRDVRRVVRPARSGAWAAAPDQ